MQRVLEMIRFGAMPPEDAELPTTKERQQLVAAIDQTLYAVACDDRPRPGRITARRLNRSEYNRSVSDLFGMSLHPADRFPSDEVGAGFDNNADVLSMSPLLLEKYLDAAEEISTQVIYDRSKVTKLNLFVPSDQLHLKGHFGVGRFNGLFFDSEHLIWLEFEVPYDGSYQVHVRSGAANKDSKSTIVLYDESGTLVAREQQGFYGGSGGSQGFTIKLKLTKGKHELIVRVADEQDLSSELGTAKRPGRVKRSEADRHQAKQRLQTPLKPDKRLDKKRYQHMLRKVAIHGPHKIPDGILPPSQYRVIRKSPPNRNGRWVQVMPAAKASLQPLMRRAFRRPVEDQEAKTYGQLVVDAVERGDSFDRGMQIAVSAVLMSPSFLFRVEIPSANTLQQQQSDGSVPVTPHQLATRMSYFLWSSLPDDSLRKDADKGKLDRNRIQWHARRMMTDSRSQSLATEFASQWLGLRNLDTHQTDTERFPEFSEDLKRSMKRETELLVEHLVKSNLPVTQLLTADYTFVNELLAKHYGIPWSAPSETDDPSRTSDGYLRVSLEKLPRRGVLSHASVLTLTSQPTRTSPVKRGKWILENILGTPPPDPPVGVADLEETQPLDANATLRQQMELHREDPSCAACHRVMDQLGFGLENYDAVGKYRQREGDREIDSSGELPGGRRFASAAELSKVLRDTESEAFAKTVVERLLTFALGREITPKDRCVIDEIVHNTKAKGFRFRDLILEVILSRPFQYYQWSLPNNQTEHS